MSPATNRVQVKPYALALDYFCQEGLEGHWDMNLEHARWTGANLMQ